MKLYATITSERASKGQGGNKGLSIKLSHETAYGSWQAIPSGINTINIEMRWNNGKPFIRIFFPKTWTEKKDIEGGINYEYNPELDDFTYPQRGKETKAKPKYLACIWCGGDISKNMPYAQYCSDECKREALGQKAKRQKGDKICKLCNNKVYGELNYCYEHRPNI